MERGGRFTISNFFQQFIRICSAFINASLTLFPCSLKYSIMKQEITSIVQANVQYFTNVPMTVPTNALTLKLLFSECFPQKYLGDTLIKMLMSDLITSQESCMSLAGNNSAFFLDQECKIPGNPTVKFQKYFRGEKVFPRRKSQKSKSV